MQDMGVHTILMEVAECCVRHNVLSAKRCADKRSSRCVSWCISVHHSSIGGRKLLRQYSSSPTLFSWSFVSSERICRASTATHNPGVSCNPVMHNKRGHVLDIDFCVRRHGNAAGPHIWFLSLSRVTCLSGFGGRLARVRPRRPAKPWHVMRPSQPTFTSTPQFPRNAQR